MNRIIPKRGELWIVNLEPGHGRELHKRRPALIISSSIVNEDTFHIIIIPATSLVPQFVGIDMIFLPKQKNLHKNSVLLPIFIRSIDQDRLITKIGKISPQKLEEVENAVKIVLALHEQN